MASSIPVHPHGAASRSALPTRRSVLAGLGLVGLAPVLAGCGGPGSTGSAPATGASGPAGSVQGDISFYHWRGEDREVIDQIIQAFVKEFPDAGVTQAIDPSTQYQATASVKARSGRVGDALTAFRGAQLVQFAEQGIFTDLSDASFKGAYVPNLLSAGAVDGVQYGYPYQLVFNMPLLNTDLAERAGLSEPPADWDAWLSALDALRGLGVEPFVWPGNDQANALQVINSLSMNLLPEENAFAGIEAGRYKATDDWWLEALARFQELSGYFQEDFAGAKTEGLVSLFAQQQAAVLPTGSYQIAQIRSAGGQFPIELAPLMTNAAGESPTYEGIHNATFILGVNGQARNADGARAWLEFLSRPEIATIYANGTAQHVPLVDIEYDNADLKALAPWSSRHTLLAPRFQFIDMDIRNAVENSLVAVANGTSPDQAAAEAQAIIDDKL